MRALYAELGRWQLVATACNGGKRTHGPGYYHQIASGRIQTPSAATRAGIESALEWHQSLLKSRFSKDRRRKVHLLDDDHAAGGAERIRLSTTWPELMHLWRLAYEDAPDPCDEKPIRG